MWARGKDRVQGHLEVIGALRLIRILIAVEVKLLEHGGVAHEVLVGQELVRLSQILKLVNRPGRETGERIFSLLTSIPPSAISKHLSSKGAGMQFQPMVLPSVCSLLRIAKGSSAAEMELPQALFAGGREEQSGPGPCAWESHPAGRKVAAIRLPRFGLLLAFSRPHAHPRKPCPAAAA
jgi:hypothetical protein